LNKKCPFSIIFGVLSGQIIHYRGMISFPISPIYRLQCESKNPACGFLTFFPNGWELLINFYTPIIRYYLH